MVLRLFSVDNTSKNLGDLTKENIINFLDNRRKSSDEDPDKKWMRTWNDYLSRLIGFYKWLVNGDSYTYRICDPGAILNYSAESYHYFTKNLEHNGSLCYTVQMDFVNMVSTDENQIGGFYPKRDHDRSREQDWNYIVLGL